MEVGANVSKIVHNNSSLNNLHLLQWGRHCATLSTPALTHDLAGDPDLPFLNAPPYVKTGMQWANIQHKTLFFSQKIVVLLRVIGLGVSSVR